MNGTLELRPAAAADASAVVPLIHDSGPVALRYVFSHAHREQSREFLEYAYREGGGEFGWRNHLVAERHGSIAAVASLWDARANFRFMRRAVRQIAHFYGARGLSVALRGLRFEQIVKPAVPGVAYVAHFTVAPDLRGQGVGRALLQRLLDRARQQGYARAGLDVADSNPRARALYEGMGFRLVATRRSALPERWSERVCDHHYLECAL